MLVEHPGDCRLAVRKATNVKRLGMFRAWHVYVWVDGMPSATAFVVSANGKRVCVAYFPSKYMGILDRGNTLTSDSKRLGISQSEMLESIYGLAVLAAGETQAVSA
ncbi:MAG: hypothetical protein V3V08_23180 [Nannocystaceae bacterium]